MRQCVLIRFSHFATFCLKHTQTDRHVRAHTRHMDTRGLRIHILTVCSSQVPYRELKVALLCVKHRRPYWILLRRAHNNSRITQACVSYGGGGFLQWSLCCPVAKQPSQHRCSCGDSKAMRKGAFKGADPMLSPRRCQWDKGRQQLMFGWTFGVMEEKAPFPVMHVEHTKSHTLLALHHHQPLSSSSP